MNILAGTELFLCLSCARPQHQALGSSDRVSPRVQNGHLEVWTECWQQTHRQTATIDYVPCFSFLKIDTYGPFCAWSYQCERTDAVGCFLQALRAPAFSAWLSRVTFIGVSMPGCWGGHVPKSSFRCPSPRWPGEEPRPCHGHVHRGAPGATTTALTSAAQCTQTVSAC